MDLVHKLRGMARAFRKNVLVLMEWCMWIFSLLYFIGFIKFLVQADLYHSWFLVGQAGLAASGMAFCALMAGALAVIAKLNK